MNVSRDEAAAALDHVTLAGARVRTWRSYSEASYYLIAWGTIWLVANVISDVRAEWSGPAWLAGVAVGAVITIALTIRNARIGQRQNPMSRVESRAFGQRAAMLGTTVLLWFPTFSLLAGPLGPRQGNALISITWAFIYMAAGAFVGWRLFAIGVVTAGAILFGYLHFTQHFSMWMGFVGGGSLILGGLWLRKI
jgi:hypothetical protein